MKQKLTLLLLALVTSMGAWAKATYFVGGRASASTIETGKKYMIYNTAYLSSGTRQWFLGASGSGYVVSQYTSTDLLSYSTTDANYVWELETGSTSGTYKIKNVGTSTYCAGGTSLGQTSKDYKIADYASCSSQGDGVTYSFEGATAIAYSAVTSDYKAVYVQGASENYWNGNPGTFVLGAKAHAYVFYEVVEIADGACYTIDFVSFDGTKTWGLSTSGTTASVSANTTGSVFVAHSYTNASGQPRWIFVNNTDGYYLAYRAATATFDISNAINEWSIGNLTAGMNSYVSSKADGTNKLYITNDKRYTDNTSKGCYILKESTNAFDNTDSPYYNGTYTSALTFTANGASVSNAAALAIAKFDAVYGGKEYAFSTTDGAFFYGLSTNVTGDGSYCNLWLSKNTTGKPQVKLITNNASSTAGNNMRSTGGLYTTDNPYQYNLSVSEGRIVSYAIIGSADGALSITPAGGSAENFAANANVYKVVELATPAKQTSFTLAGSSQWLNVTKFIVKYESDATAVTNLSDFESDGIYTITCYSAERGGMYAGTEYLDACGGHANTDFPANKNIGLDATDGNQQFAIYTHGDNKYLYNIGRGKFVGSHDSYYYKMTGAPVNAWSVSEGAYTGYFRLTSQEDSKKAVLNAWVDQSDDSKYDYGIIGTTADENANNFAFLKVGTLTSEQIADIETIFTNYDALQTSLTTLGNYTIGSDLGEYTHASFTTNEAKETAITNIQNGLKDCAASDIPTANTSVQNLITGMTLNPVTTGTFLRVYTKHNTYLNGVATTGGYVGFISCVSTPNKSSIFYYDSDNRLIDYGQGYKANGSYAGSVGGSGVAYTFGASATGAPGTYAITFTENETTKYLSAFGEGYNLAVGENSDNVNGAFTLEAVTTLPVTMTPIGGRGGYASFYAPVGISSLPKGVKAYIATLTTSRVQFEAIESIPAETAVVLYMPSCNEETTINLPIGDASASTTDNVLRGNVATVALGEQQVMTMQVVGDDLGFYKYNGTSLGGFKAYVNISDIPSDIKSFALDLDDDATSIETIDHSTLTIDQSIYNVAGQRISKMQKGINIVNGKKVMVK